MTMFTSRTISRMPRRRSYFFKYMTMFFLWASAVMLATQAFDISTALNNSVQYISKIILTSDGSNAITATTGIILDGSGNASFFGTGWMSVNIWDAPYFWGRWLNINWWDFGGAMASWLWLIDSPSMNMSFISSMWGPLILWNSFGMDVTISGHYVNIGSSISSFDERLTVDGNIKLNNAWRIGATGNQIFMAGNGNVGLGTTSLGSNIAWRVTKLSIMGNDDTTGWLTRMMVANGPSYSWVWLWQDNEGDAYLYNNQSKQLYLWTSGQTILWLYTDHLLFSNPLWMGTQYNQLYFSGNGYVGIGTNTPTEVLEVNGNIALSAWADRTLWVNRAIYSGEKGRWLTISAGSAYLKSDNWWDLTLAWWNQWSFWSALAGVGWNVYIYPWNGTIAWNVILAYISWSSFAYPYGKVGIGTNNPIEALTVSGNIRLNYWNIIAPDNTVENCYTQIATGWVVNNCSIHTFLNGVSLDANNAVVAIKCCEL